MSRPRYSDGEIAKRAARWSQGKISRVGDFAEHIFAPRKAISPQCLQIRRAIIAAGGSFTDAPKRTDSTFSIGSPAEGLAGE